MASTKINNFCSTFCLTVDANHLTEDARWILNKRWACFHLLVPANVITFCSQLLVNSTAIKNHPNRTGYIILPQRGRCVCKCFSFIIVVGLLFCFAFYWCVCVSPTSRHKLETFVLMCPTAQNGSNSGTKWEINNSMLSLSLSLYLHGLCFVNFVSESSDDAQKTECLRHITEQNNNMDAIKSGYDCM